MLRSRALVLATSAAFFVAIAVPALCAVQTPEQFLGHPVGADRKLADYGQIVRYFEALDAGSDRLTLHRLGKTTLNRDMIMAVISSEANVRDVERYRDIARRLADPRGLDPAEAERLVREGKTIVLVGCNIHSSEIGASQMSMEWAWHLATTDDPTTRQWLDDVILLLIPSLNPDGTDMIVDYYRKNVGTKWEGGRLPWLYHHYAGHDNNRDWYMLNLVETRLVNRVLHHDWFPQVFLDEHQMGQTGPRIFVPPYADPLTTLVHPMQWRLNDLVGTHMALRLEQGQKSGVIYSYAYDAYWPGGTKNTSCLKNVIGLLTEVSSCRIATPVYVDANELAGGRKGLPVYRAQMNFPNPWPGGWWRLRDIIDYELIASNSLIETCSRYRAEILRAFYDMGKDAIDQGRKGSPYAYVIPATQHDPSCGKALVDLMRENGVEAHIAREAFNAGNHRFDKGSVVFLTQQPYRPFLVEMMERQRYPEVRQSTDSKDIYKPYDVTAWTLPLLMGVDWTRVDEPFTADLEVLKGPMPVTSGQIGEGKAAYVVRASSNQAARAVNRLLADRVVVSRAREGFTVAAGTFTAGDFIVPGSASRMIEKLAGEGGVEIVALEAAPEVKQARLRTPRIALYKPWAASMDEGWTRLVLDRHDFKYTNLDNAGMKMKNLRERFDVIVLPDVDRPTMVEGKPRSEEGPGYFEALPPAYSGGIGKDGVENLKRFVEAGGTLVCLTESSALPLEDFNIPVRDLVAKAKPSEFSVPGTLVNIDLDTTHPLCWGMPAHIAAYSTGGPVFGTSPSGPETGRSVVARYPEYADQVVASGWAEGEDRMAGKPAIVEAKLGAGRVVMFGPRVQHRAQTWGTYKLLFNALYRSVMED